ncbi:MAG: LysR family transcriptional regulator [Nocardioides sp.]|uniref:LysR family transcriptional regulator n=1 Tax=Nocardioides sp. TaxID=35761 RepID=UPI0039E2B442
MTPTQLRAFASVVRLGSVKAAAADLGVTEAAVSLHVGQLRKELGDKLFTRTSSGLAFTPGGLRLASRAVELLGLQDRTVLEVRAAGAGRRLLRLATTSLFAEYAAPGLIEFFADRARDLDVELSVHRSRDFESLLLTRSVDATIGPRPATTEPGVSTTLFLNYQILAVVAPDHPLTHTGQPGAALLRSQTWLLGPAAAGDAGVIPQMLRRIGVPEERQQIFQSHAAAVEEAKRGTGVSLAVSFAVAQDLAAGTLAKVPGRAVQGQGSWNISILAGKQAPSAAEEMARFVTTPRATQAMLRGRSVTHGRFKPAIHVTLWS